MIKIFRVIVLLSGLSFLPLHAQTDTLSLAQFDSLFIHLDASRVPHGILIDKALLAINPENYDGSSGAHTAGPDEFAHFYKAFIRAQIPDNNLNLPSWETFENEWFHNRQKFNETSPGHIILAGMYMQYARLDSTALDEGRIRMENNRLYDAYDSTGRWLNPYVEKELFMIVPPVERYKYGNVEIALPGYLMTGNGKNLIQRIELDPGDGQGYRSLKDGQSVHTNYTAGGTYRWTFRMILADGTTRYAYSDFTVQLPASNTNNCQTDIYDVAGAVLRIKYAPSHNCTIAKPLIVAEGFDPDSYLVPSDDHGSLSMDEFLDNFRTTNSSGRLHDLLIDPQEYDIIYVDWRDGTADIYRNAEVFKNVIKWVHLHKMSDESMVVLGQSMGGLVARIALKELENEDYFHWVRLFIAHDSPMQGADVPLGFQFAQREAQAVYNVVGMVVPIVVDYGSHQVNASRFFDILDRPASRQMLYYHVGMNRQVDAGTHENFVNSLEQLGYPQQCRNVVISNGNECGVDQGFAPHDMIWQIYNSPNWGLIYDLHVRANPLPQSNQREVLKFYAAVSSRIFWHRFVVTLLNIQRYAPYGTLPFETYSGGYYMMDDPNDPNDDIEGLEVNYFGFIPVPSALDIHKHSGTLTHDDYLLPYGDIQALGGDYYTPFDNYIVDYNRGVNRPHISFQRRNGNWMADEMENPPAVATHCTSFCDAGEREIEGPQVVCSTADYQIPGFDNVYWYENGSFVNIISQNPSGTATLESTIQNASGPGQSFILTAHAYNECTGSLTKERTLWVGNPSFDIHKDGNCGYVMVTLTNYNPDMQGITDVTWELENSRGNNSIVSSDNFSAELIINESDNLTITVTNDCGSYTKNVAFDCSNMCSTPDYDLILVPVGDNKYRIQDPCHPDEEKYIDDAELYDQYGVKIADLVPENNNKEVNIPPGQSGQIRVIKAISADGKLARRLIIVN